ncbi:MAG: cytidine deaminase [Ignavibacteriae bacterium]|nr:cytidine deaminase [Ignavibacteriota bacterium]
MKKQRLSSTYKKLIDASAKAKKNSYSPYSRFRVGAALLTSTGEIILGCNVENSSYGLTNCAERTVLFKAISDGKRKFKAIALSTDADEFIPPCGACRQVIMELAGDIDIIMTNKKGNVQTKKTSELLPMAFKPEMLQKD